MSRFDTSCCTYHSVSDVESGVNICAQGSDSIILDGIWSDEPLPNSAELVVRFENREVMNVPITYFIQKDHGLWEIPFTEFASAGLPAIVANSSSARYNVQVVNGVSGTKLYYRCVYLQEPWRRACNPIIKFTAPVFNVEDPRIAMLPPGRYTGFLIPRSIPRCIKITLDIGSLRAFEIDYMQIMLHGKARGDYIYFPFSYTAAYETKLSVNTPVDLRYATVSLIL